MPGSFLTDTERDRLRRFPSDVPPEDLAAYFTLSDREGRKTERLRSPDWHHCWTWEEPTGVAERPTAREKAEIPGWSWRKRPRQARLRLRNISGSLAA